jgi:hypothetical protein
MIISSHDDTNAVIIFEGLELKTLNLLLSQVTPQQAMKAAMELHEAGFDYDETHVAAVAKVFGMVTKTLCDHVSKKICKSCGVNHEDEEDEDDTPSVN